ncbi:MAG: hypothetical protein ACPGYL_13170 [Rhodospirillaceae bacterium]
MAKRSACSLGAVLSAGLLLSGTAMAQPDSLRVAFIEAAPKDRFILVNGSECPMSDFKVTIDLKGSKAGLLFDTQSGGPGVNVYQPLEVAYGSEFLTKLPTLQDGDRQAVVEFESLEPGQHVILTVDVDDTVPSGPMGEQMIASSEISGAKVILDMALLPKTEASFGESGKALLPVIPGCQIS